MATSKAGITSLIVVAVISFFPLHSAKAPVIPPVKNITSDNWHHILEGEWMVKFFAPWCPACQQVGPVWSKLALKADELGINVGEVDTTKEPALSGRFMVLSLPTIYHIKNGEFRQFKGSRSLKGLMVFVKDQKWRDIEPLPWWKSPGSYLMGFLGLMFKLSVLLKNMHELLTLTYGVPVWGSYTIFGVVVVATGILLGMGIVFLSDCILGVPSYPVPVQQMRKVIKEEPEEDNGEDERDGEEIMEENEGNGTDQTGVRKRVTASTD
ncbi:thioredoxin-related transmembrane protein 1-like [Stylophora pistillata]|nr:thioredoxin-related transmembrane protein 1-like [Stylophora pistillata]